MVEFGFIMPADNLNRTRRTSYVAELDRALELVSGHFDSAWCIDHLQFGESDLLEGWTLLTYMAARHPRLNFGHTVLSQSFRNPALLAKMAATFQFLSGGRFILGLGAGWHEEEYRAYGYPFPRGAVRVEQTEEALRIIRSLWTASPAQFEGRHYRIESAHCEPRPEPAPPIVLGAFKPRMLQLAARYADWWNASSTSARHYSELSAQLDAACGALGRDPARLRRTWAGGCVCAPTEALARSRAADRGSSDDEDFDFAGTPSQVIEQMAPFVALGVDYFMLDCGGWPDTTTLELLVSDVLPALRRHKG